MSNNNALLEFLTEAQPVLLIVGLFITVIGLLFLLASILDGRRNQRRGRAQQFSSVPGVLGIGIGIFLLVITPAMTGLYSMLSY